MLLCSHVISVTRNSCTCNTSNSVMVSEVVRVIQCFVHPTKECAVSLRVGDHPAHAKKNSGLVTQNLLQQLMENYTQLCSSIPSQHISF